MMKNHNFFYSTWTSFHRQEHIQGHTWDGVFFAEIYSDSMVQYQAASANVQQYDKVLPIVSLE